MATRYGDTPFIVRGGQEDYKNIFYTSPNEALTKEVTLIPGCGVVKAGTALAKITGDGPSKNKYVPYNPTTISNADTVDEQKGRAFLVADAETGASVVYVTIEDSYKFQVGDQIYIADDDTKTSSSEDLGVITAIDRSTYRHMAKITATNNISGTVTVAKYASIFHEAGADNSNTWSDSVGILATTVDTGEGEHAQGAVADMVISNAMLYNGMLTNVDAAARTDLGATVDGQFLILK